MPNGKIRVAPLYGSGAAMGFTPQQVNQMSMWQFYAALNGYIEANSPKGGAKLSDSEIDDLANFVEQADSAKRMLRTMTYLWDGYQAIPNGEVTFEV